MYLIIFTKDTVLASVMIHAFELESSLFYILSFKKKGKIHTMNLFVVFYCFLFVFVCLVGFFVLFFQDIVSL